MPTNLIVVESPAKAKTMSKYLGKEFTALASYGHVRDLVPKQGAVDTENDFAMKYGLIEKNEKHVDAIVKAMKKADALYLATDPDREGEAISWHLYEILKERGALLEDLVQVPGDGLTLAVRVGGEIERVGLLHRLDDGVHVLLVFLDQPVLHGEIIFGVDRALLRHQVAHMTVGGQGGELHAQIFGHGFGLGRGFNDNQIRRHEYQLSATLA